MELKDHRGTWKKAKSKSKKYIRTFGPQVSKKYERTFGKSKKYIKDLLDY